MSLKPEPAPTAEDLLLKAQSEFEYSEVEGKKIYQMFIQSLVSKSLHLKTDLDTYTRGKMVSFASRHFMKGNRGQLEALSNQANPLKKHLMIPQVSVNSYFKAQKQALYQANQECQVISPPFRDQEPFFTMKVHSLHYWKESAVRLLEVLVEILGSETVKELETESKNVKDHSGETLRLELDKLIDLTEMRKPLPDGQSFEKFYRLIQPGGTEFKKVLRLLRNGIGNQKNTDIHIFQHQRIYGDMSMEEVVETIRNGTYFREEFADGEEGYQAWAKLPEHQKAYRLFDFSSDEGSDEEND